MRKQKFTELLKNEDVLLTSLALKFRKAGYKSPADSDSKEKEDKNDSPFTITPINPDNNWCFNVCKTERY